MLYRLVIKSIENLEQSLTLNPEQQHYLKRVLRLKNGDRFVALDGQGKSYIAQLQDESAQILENLEESTELAISITLIVALPKGNGFDEIVRCCTELGVTTLIPVISQRTLLKPSTHKLQRWRKIATEAAEQSERQVVPTIFEATTLKQSLKNIDKMPSNRYICVSRKPAHHLLTYLSEAPPNPVIIATGCEGGWTKAEIEMAIALGFQPVSLGRRILRAITAPIVALSLAVSTIESETIT
ncbi:MAG TPA: 16S rRNA (uracil(1498)-N(3))-methyltransferase [Cyanothece sp. UBA12306]|nr:16S rRNA (uracil(1498)-N(3))-methyltransferase [Cyanothece sp. UBA12306]